MGRVYRLLEHLYDLISRSSGLHGSRLRSFRRAEARLRRRIRNLINEVHKKTVHWLITNFDLILLPSFDSHSMASRGHRRLRSTTVRQMFTWSHARFRDRLVAKAEELGKKVLTDISEAYTSKTCSSCGWINHKLGGSEIFKCISCHVTLDRDLNAARGILLRTLGSGRIEIAPSTTALPDGASRKRARRA